MNVFDMKLLQSKYTSYDGKIQSP